MMQLYRVLFSTEMLGAPVRHSPGHKETMGSHRALSRVGCKHFAGIHTHTHGGRLARGVMECGHNGVTVAMETGGGLPPPKPNLSLSSPDSDFCLSASCGPSLDPDHIQPRALSV